MAAIMSLEEPRPRGMVLGERADRLRVGEAYHFFRCKACNGWIDARDYVWVLDHEGPLPHPAQDQRNSATGSSARAGGACEHGRRNVLVSSPTHDDAGLMILRRRLALRSRNHLDQNYKPSLHRFIFDGGVGAQQSEAENAVGDEQAVDI